MVGLAKASGRERFAWDSYRRLLQMFGHSVMGVDAGLFERVVEAHKTALSVTDDHALDAEELANAVEEFKGVIRRETGEGFPQDPSAPGRTDNSAITCALWRPTTATYATSSSQSSEDVCGFCRRGWASAPPRPLSGSRASSTRRARSRPMKLWPASTARN